MRNPSQILTRRFKIEGFADDVAEVVVDLNHDDFQAVSKVLHALSNQRGYVAKFRISEVDADGDVVREVMPL